MLGRFLCGAALLLVGGGLCGCFDAVEGQVDEQKNPYFLTAANGPRPGITRARLMRLKGARGKPAFGPGALELGVLYEQHDEDEDHFISRSIITSGPWICVRTPIPRGNAKERIAVCKRELVKVESFAPIINSWNASWTS